MIKLCIRRIGIVSRNYSYRFPDGRRDFSHTLPCVLSILDDERCDSILFSLFSISAPPQYVQATLAKTKLRYVKAIFLEFFEDYPRRRPQSKQRIAGPYVVYTFTNGRWLHHAFRQQFGRNKDRHDIARFVSKIIPQRVFGDCCLLICGESNVVRYSPDHKVVIDTYGVTSAIPPDAKTILNPVHDRMTRFEMPLKRSFLSRRSRWVVSVWNKGKRDVAGRVRDGQGPPWAIYHNGILQNVEPISNELNIEIGIVDIT